MSRLLGVDTGGTFTDFVLLEQDSLRIHKVLSTPDAPEQAILQGVRELGLEGAEDLLIVHGSTVATNAALEGKGVRTAYITNRGFADTLSIGRQNRAQLYELQPKPVAPPVPSELCLETGGRLAADGSILEPLSDEDLEVLRRSLEALRPQAVAINLLFSFLDDRAEKAIEACVPQGMFVSRASAILPEYREYERGITTWLNAWVGPLVKLYLGRLTAGLPGARISVMQSSGGTIAAGQAGDQAVHMLLSGPAGGLAAARYVAGRAGQGRLLTFDMGGTSTDVAMIDGDLRLTTEGRIGPYPVAVPMVDMHTIGAGGGSIAYLDEGGLLQVGPQSAGAAPGPACYGRGGTEPTVTDANLVLGRLRAEAFLGGGMPLDEAAARAAIASLAGPLGLGVEETAEGILAIANEHMARALRVMSVQRGVDPRELSLVSFGGAGGLHVCALAEALGMRQAMIPVHGGVLSALGMLVAPRARQLSRTLNLPLADTRASVIDGALAQLAEQGLPALLSEGVAESEVVPAPSLDLRYQGQSYTLNLPWQGNTHGVAEAFHQAHQARYGHAMEDLVVELVNVRLQLRGPEPRVALGTPEATMPASPRWANLHGIASPVAIYERQELTAGQEIPGPALVTERVSTSFITAGWSCRVDESGTLLLQALGD